MIKHMLLTSTTMTAVERAKGRFMRAPEHPTGAESDTGGGSGSEPPAPTGDTSAADVAAAGGAPAGGVAADTDDFAAFENATSFGEVDSPAPGADAGDEPPASEEQPKPESEGGDEEKKGKSAQERIDEVTATAREAERRAAELERTLNDPAELRKRLEAAEAGAKKPEATADGLLEGQPDPKDYAFGEADPEFVKDAATFWSRVEFQKQERIKALNDEFEQIDKSYNERAEKAVERYPDFEEKVVAGATKGTWKASPVMALAMKTSDVGPDVAYHLATNPSESERIAKLSPLEQAREMGRLEGRFEHQEKQKAEPEPKTISAAPPPPSSVTRGSGARAKVSEDTDDFAAFDKAYGNS